MDPKTILALPYRPCVGIVVANQQGKIFTGQRLDAEKLGTPAAWQMPQGGVEEGENPQQAALRELEEETGIAANLVRVEAERSDWLTYDLPHDLVPKVWKGRYRGQKQRWFLLRFLGDDTDVNIKTIEPEFSKWQWMSPDDVIKNIIPFKRELYQQVIDGFKSEI